MTCERKLESTSVSARDQIWKRLLSLVAGSRFTSRFVVEPARGVEALTYGIQKLTLVCREVCLVVWRGCNTEFRALVSSCASPGVSVSCYNDSYRTGQPTLFALDGAVEVGSSTPTVAKRIGWSGPAVQRRESSVTTGWARGRADAANLRQSHGPMRRALLDTARATQALTRRPPPAMRELP